MENEICSECGSSGLCKCRQLGSHKRDVKHARERSQHQEQTIAKSYQKVGYPKARRIPMSGGIATMKGDVSVEDFMLVEAKESKRGVLRIDPMWVDKIEREAKDAGKQWWGLHAWVSAGEDNYRKIVFISEKMWYSILEALNARTN